MTRNQPAHGTVNSTVAGLAELTVGKTVANTAVRWIATFLPVLSTALRASTATLTGIMGAAELAGLATSLTGGLNDRGHERKVFAGGLVVIAISSLIGLIGTTTSFAVSFTLLIIGASHATVAAHSWIGHRVPFADRGRAIGRFEISWALGLLLGAPVIAALLALFGWRAAYIGLALSALAAATLVWFRVPPSGYHHTASTVSARLPRSAWPPMLASAAAAHAGIGFFVIAGTWLADAHAMGTIELGVIAAAYGAVEMVSSVAVATITDRVGPRRAVAVGLAIVSVAIATLTVGGTSTPVAIGGVIVFLGGFEYAFVSSLTLVTEAAPESRGRAIGISSALGTIGRASGVALAGVLYERHGIGGPLAGAAIATTVSAGFLWLSRTPGGRSDRPARPPRRGVYWGRNDGRR